MYLLCVHVSVLLGIGLLQQGTPKLIGISRVDEDELSIVSRELVVHNNVHPLTKVPESKVKDTSIPIAPSLFKRYNLWREGRGEGREKQGGRGGVWRERGYSLNHVNYVLHTHASAMYRVCN